MGPVFVFDFEFVWNVTPEFGLAHLSYSSQPYQGPQAFGQQPLRLAMATLNIMTSPEGCSPFSSHIVLD